MSSLRTHFIAVAALACAGGYLGLIKSWEAERNSPAPREIEFISTQISLYSNYNLRDKILNSANKDSGPIRYFLATLLNAGRRSPITDFSQIANAYKTKGLDQIITLVGVEKFNLLIQTFHNLPQQKDLAGIVKNLNAAFSTVSNSDTEGKKAAAILAFGLREDPQEGYPDYNRYLNPQIIGVLNELVAKGNNLNPAAYITNEEQSQPVSPSGESNEPQLKLNTPQRQPRTPEPNSIFLPKCKRARWLSCA